ncbi:DUF423 domain-containing protein [Oceanobacillus sp. 1P07AA]|uniref:DUF423 domain-containing protein n=1 Tax=Oceanobacillus sp. 1P07AA TaxID=3132293 RepID=UPI0039A5C661
MKIFLIIGAVLGFLAVALGAFGAHGLEGKLSEKAMNNWGKAVDYQMFHTIAIIAVALLLAKFEGSGLLTTSGWMFLVGIILFSGSLYVYSFTSITTFAMITPIGGLAFLIGWVLLGIAGIRLL